MRILRAGAERGQTLTPWLDSRHAFSFGRYHDPRWMGFGPLRVINEDRVAVGGGFPPHRHANMEILSYVVSGALAHADDTGGGGTLRPGELQWMSAGHGIEHSEFNADPGVPVHFLQIWIQPDRVNATPAYAQRAFPARERQGRWGLLASPDGADGSIAIRQQAWLRGAFIAPGQSLDWTIDAARLAWLQVVAGTVEVDGGRLSAGDGLAVQDEGGTLVLRNVGDAPVELLAFDLPR